MSIQEQSEILKSLQLAHGKVNGISRYFVPCNGIEIAYSNRNPRSIKDIATVNDISIGFGVDSQITRVIFTVLRFDEDMRSVGIIRYTDEIADIIRTVIRDVNEYDPDKFPAGISSMDWGIASCCKDGVPRSIIKKGKTEKESQIYIFGYTPDEVSNIILITCK